ncbi:MAG: stage II sporulation protein M [Candidatus Ozemobacteraceae bacterium]
MMSPPEDTDNVVPPAPPREVQESQTDELPEHRWDRLDEILCRMERAFFEATPADISELGILYQMTLADLGRARAKGDNILAGNLNGLVGRAYSQIYRKPSLRVMDIATFYWSEFPALVRERIHYFLVALLIFVFSFAIGFLCISHDSKLLELLLPTKIKSALESGISSTRFGTEFALRDQLALSSAYLLANIQFAALAFVGGLPIGLGTIYLLIINGIILGGLASMAHGAGLLLLVSSLLAPHGIIELLAVFLCSGSGLIIAFALIKPGQHRRRDWLAHEGLDAVKILAGTLPLFLFAAMVEAYVTPLALAPLWNFLIGAILLELLLMYLALGGISLETMKDFFRKRSRAAPEGSTPLLR